MKFGPEVALDDTIADTKFQGPGYTTFRGITNTRIIFDQAALALAYFECSSFF